MNASRAGALLLGLVALAGLGGPAGPARAQSDQDTMKKIEEYRQALAEGNPADLWEARGEEMWKQKRGPRQVSFEACDLGKGPGVVKGAYAELPRYFADAGQVMDLESRLVYCMVDQQGYSRAQALARPFGNGSDRSDIEALAARCRGSIARGQDYVPCEPSQGARGLRAGERYFSTAAARTTSPVPPATARPSLARRLSDRGDGHHRTAPWLRPSPVPWVGAGACRASIAGGSSSVSAGRMSAGGRPRRPRGDWVAAAPSG